LRGFGRFRVFSGAFDQNELQSLRRRRPCEARGAERGQHHRNAEDTRAISSRDVPSNDNDAFSIRSAQLTFAGWKPALRLSC
jgi:hypothetical protein